MFERFSNSESEAADENLRNRKLKKIDLNDEFNKITTSAETDTHEENTDLSDDPDFIEEEYLSYTKKPDSFEKDEFIIERVDERKNTNLGKI